MEFCKVVPDGLLIFFPSYDSMEKCMNQWSTCDIWSRIGQLKPICVETREKDEFNDAKKRYNDCINNNKGAVFMAALRGKVSEGLDFADMYGRAAVIIGIPYAYYADLKVELKRKYLDSKKAIDNRMISGSDWYKLDAIRAVNQAVGRVIRHVNDYGAILFCDERFNIPSTKVYISSWVKSQMKVENCGINTTVEQLEHFYAECEKTVFQRLTFQYR